MPTIEESFEELQPITINFNANKTIETIDNDKEQQIDLNQTYNHRQKKQKVQAKTEQRILDLQKKRAKDLNGMLDQLLDQYQEKKTGIKIQQYSPLRVKNMDLIHHGSPENNFQRRVDYPDYSSSLESRKNTIKSISKDSMSPQQVKDKKFKDDYVNKILNKGSQNDKLLNIVREFYDQNIDSRSLNHFKKCLLESENVFDGHLLPLNTFNSIKQSVMKDKMENSINELLNLIKHDQISIDIMKLSEIIDLYNFLPVYIKKNKNNSNEVYYILTSNKRGQDDKTQIPIKHLDGIKLLLHKISQKLNERFLTIGQAFMYFDSDSNQAITFNEFYNGLDKLKVKLSDNEIHQVFKYLDKDEDDTIGYQEFCLLLEEKINGLDPFENIAIKQAQNNNIIKQGKEDPYNIYLDNTSIEQLEQLSKFKPLSLAKRKLRGHQSQEAYKRQGNQQQKALAKKPSQDNVSSENMESIIHHQYLKDHLQQQITRNAMDSILTRNYQPRSQLTNASKLRSKSVEKHLLKSTIEQHIENMKQSKADQGIVTFKEILQEQRKLGKDIQLPPINNKSQTRPFDELLNKFKTTQNHNQTIDFIDNSRSTSLSNTPLKNINPKIKRNQADLLEEVHQMRINLLEQNNQNQRDIPDKPNITKREMQDILGSYFNAKKRLNNLKFK